MGLKQKANYEIASSAKKNVAQENASSRSTLESGVFFGEMFAGDREQNGKEQVVLVYGGKESVLDEGIGCSQGCSEEDAAHSKNFSDVKFSPKGTYLTYVTHGWESLPTAMYDIQKSAFVEGSVADDLRNSSVEFVFTPDEKFLFVCSEAGMTSERGGKVYTTPDFKVAFDVFKNAKVRAAVGDIDNFLAVHCDHISEDGDIFRFYVSQYQADSKQNDSTGIVTFNVRTGEIGVEMNRQ